jgi:hypothetical protein
MLRSVMRMRPSVSGYVQPNAGGVGNAGWNTSPVRVQNAPMNRMPPSNAPRAICLDPPTYGQQPAGMFQNVANQGNEHRFSAVELTLVLNFWTTALSQKVLAAHKKVDINAIDTSDHNFNTTEWTKDF